MACTCHVTAFAYRSVSCACDHYASGYIRPGCASFCVTLSVSPRVCCAPPPVAVSLPSRVCVSQRAAPFPTQISTIRQLYLCVNLSLLKVKLCVRHGRFFGSIFDVFCIFVFLACPFAFVRRIPLRIITKMKRDLFPRKQEKTRRFSRRQTKPAFFVLLVF